MPIRVFSFWILILTVGILQGYSIFREHFNGKFFVVHEVKVLKAKLLRQEMRTQLAHYQLSDFQQTVAVMLPKGSKGLGAYQKRTIASIVQAPNDDKLQLETSDTAFEKAKRDFRSGNFDQAADQLKHIIERYPLSRNIIDSYFLLVESKYQMNEFDECVDYIDSMVTLFPEHDLTGFALLRMGQIFTSRDRLEDSEQVYHTVIDNFSSNAAIVDQARRLLKDISL